MTTNDAPADTRMMGIVHSALRRDLLRARDVLAAPPPPEGRQRIALGEHVTWLMDFLHGHHSGEDAGLWPLVRSRTPAAAELLDSLEADHARIAPAAEAVDAAARAYTTTTTDPSRVVLVDALDRLVEVLLPHLDREVDEAMPVVSASITAREWDALEQEYFVKDKSTRELAMEGHWLLENIDAEGYRVVVHTVPPVLRFVLIHGFGPAYRRRARARWSPAAPARSTVAR
jgi:hemerythrin-like domain-containing protein